MQIVGWFGDEFLQYINDIIKSGNVSKLRNSKGKTLEQLLTEQAEYLKELIIKNIHDYRRAYKPARYQRKNNLENSVEVSSRIKCVGGVYMAYVYFNEKAVHRSGYGVWRINGSRNKFGNDDNDFDSDESVNVAYLIDRGYIVQQPVWFKDFENFGHREGNGFVEKAIAEFNRTNSLGIFITASDVIERGAPKEW